jgi:cytochrome c553
MKHPLRAAALLFCAVAAPVFAQTTPAGAKGAGEPTRANVSMCTGCHTIPGYQASFPQVYRVPMISGQSAQYIRNALTQYRNGERMHPSMQAIASQLTDEEIAQLADYSAARGADGAAGASKK